MPSLCQHLLAGNQGTAQLSARLRPARLGCLGLFAGGHAQAQSSRRSSTMRRSRSSTKTIPCCPIASSSGFSTPLFQAAAGDRSARHQPLDGQRTATHSFWIFRLISSATSSPAANPPSKSMSTRPPWSRPGSAPAMSEQIIHTQIDDFLSRSESSPLAPVSLDIRVAFNPECHDSAGSRA